MIAVTTLFCIALLSTIISLVVMTSADVHSDDRLPAVLVFIFAALMGVSLFVGMAEGASQKEERLFEKGIYEEFLNEEGDRELRFTPDAQKLINDKELADTKAEIAELEKKQMELENK